MKKMRVKQRGKQQKRKNRTESEPPECACVCVFWHTGTYVPCMSACTTMFHVEVVGFLVH